MNMADWFENITKQIYPLMLKLESCGERQTRSHWNYTKLQYFKMKCYYPCSLYSNYDPHLYCFITTFRSLSSLPFLSMYIDLCNVRGIPNWTICLYEDRLIKGSSSLSRSIYTRGRPEVTKTEMVGLKNNKDGEIVRI